MLESLIGKLQNYVMQSKAFRPYNGVIENTIEILNSERIITLTGLKYTGKTELVGEMIRKTGSQKDFFYFNPHLDTLNSIKNKKDLIFLLDYRIRTHGPIKIIILEDCNLITDIKSLILELFNSKNFKIIIVGNNIKIDGVKEIKLFPLSSYNLPVGLLPYGGLPHIRIVPDLEYKKILLEAFMSDILQKEVYYPYSIKNQENFRSLLAFLSHHHEAISLRELQRRLEECKISTSLITLIEYINIALTTKIIYKQEVYDIKRSSTVQSQSVYQFSDIGLRLYFNNYDTIEYTNIIGNEYLQRGYDIYIGKYGVLQFDIYAVKGEKQIGIIVSQSTDKIEIRKLARKLAKVPSLTSRYVLVPDISKLGIRKLEEDGVRICELEEIFESIN